MAKKIKLNLSGLKNQAKTGTVSITYLNGTVDYPIKLKDDRTYRNIMSLGDYKFKTKLEGNKLVTTNLQKLSNVKAEYRDIIMNSEGYGSNDISYVKIYDENDLILAKIDRESMFDAISVIAHLDLDFVVDEKKNLTFLELINETFKEIIDELYKGKPIEREDYYKVTEVLYKANLLSYDIINEFSLNISAIRNGTTVEEETYKLEAQRLGLTPKATKEYVQSRLKQDELLNLNEKETEDEIETVEEIL